MKPLVEEGLKVEKITMSYLDNLLKTGNYKEISIVTGKKGYLNQMLLLKHVGKQ